MSRLRRILSNVRLRERSRSWRAYWTAKGVIPRWQLVAVYLLITGIGIAGFYSINQALDRIQQSRVEACDAAADRNRDTKAEINRQIELLPEPRKTRAKQQAAATFGIINTLTPARTHAQCVELVRVDQE